MAQKKTQVDEDAPTEGGPPGGQGERTEIVPLPATGERAEASDLEPSEPSSPSSSLSLERSDESSLDGGDDGEEKDGQAAGAEDADEGDQEEEPDEEPVPEGEDLYGEDEEVYGDDGAELGDDPESSGPREVSGERAAAEAPDSPDATRAGPPIKLEIVSGPDAGKIKRFAGVRLVIGRVKGCDLRLTDASVSRRHLELVQGDNGVLLRDLGSGNGTRLNGEKVSERLLKHHDEIAIGETRMRFVDELASFGRQAEKDAAPAPFPQAIGREERPAKALTKPEVASGTDLRWLILGVGVLMALCIVAAGWLLLGTDEGPQEARLVAHLVEGGRRALREERYEEAIDLFRRAERLKPAPDVEKLAELAERELAVSAGLQRARELLAKRQFEEAREALSGLSPPNDRRRHQILEVQEEILEQEEAAKNASADEPVPAVEEPEESENVAPPRVAPEGSERRRRSDDSRRSQREKARQAAKSAVVDRAFDLVARRFHAGEFLRAALECDRVIEEYGASSEIGARAKELKRLIPSFGQNFEDGQKKFKSGALESSVKPLRKARALYQQIGFPGALGKSIDQLLVAAALAAGKTALAAEEWSVAVASYREAAQLAPGEERAREGLRLLSRKGEEIYLQAFMKLTQDPQEAARKLRLVLELTPPGSATHEKAKKHLKSLDP